MTPNLSKAELSDLDASLVKFTEVIDFLLEADITIGVTAWLVAQRQ